MARPRKNPTPPAQSGQQVPQDRPTQDAQQGDQTVTGDAPQVPEGQQHAEPQPQPQAMPATAVEPLDQFLRRVERVHIERDVVATAATHPHASERVWPGTYGGIRLSAGPVSVTYSDGTNATE